VLIASQGFRCVCLWFIGFSFLAVPFPGFAQNLPSEPAKVTVSDAIRMTVWANREYFLGGVSNDPVALFSPDGTQFVIVLRRGNLEANTNEYSLLLFWTKDAFNNPKPDVLTTMSSSSNHEAIENVRWLNDNETVVFLGENVGENPEIYSLNVKSLHLEKLTHHPTPVVAYDISPNGQTIVYEAAPQRTSSSTTEATRKNGVVISTQNPSELFLSECTNCQEVDQGDDELFLQPGRSTASRVFVADHLWGYLPLSVSPDGRHAVLEAYVSDIPPSWSAYQDPLLHPYIIEPSKPGQRSNVTRYMLLDTSNGEISPLLNAPISWFNDALIWAKDGKSVILSGVYLPLDVADLAEREVREKHTFVVEVELPSKSIVKISDRALKAFAWNQRTEVVSLKPEDSNEPAPEAYKKAGASWSPVPVTSESIEPGVPLEVSIEEDSNTPPKIYAKSMESHRSVLLFDLNPQFSHFTFGKVESVKWKATDGHEVVGGLYLPPDYKMGKRYPLVIQTHGFQKDRFWIDGPWSSAFAAQPLAAQDIVVLQVGSSANPGEEKSYRNTPREAPRQMAAYEGAIDYLDERGLIDRTRVGLIGFSRTVSYVSYTLTHSKYPFAAATLADGFDAGYVNFTLWGGLDYVAANGGLPFGASLSSWIEHSPGFNLDKVNAAVRLEYYGWGGFLVGWQSFSGLSVLKKPVDFIWLPYGMHLLVKPWERLVSQQGNVDWFDFWLKGVDDPDPSKKAEYERWNQLRRNKAKPE
jgi:dipeptidyl aminopeptidase/acylaminoacyl peptidase